MAGSTGCEKRYIPFWSANNNTHSHKHRPVCFFYGQRDWLPGRLCRQCCTFFFGSSLLFFFSSLSSNLRIALSILFDGIAFISPGYGPPMNDSKKKKMKKEDKFNFECVNRIYEQTTLSNQMGCIVLLLRKVYILHLISGPFCAFILLCLFGTSTTQIL